MTFVERHAGQIVMWLLVASWAFHFYLLTGSIVSDDGASLTYEATVLTAHELAILGLCIYALRRRHRGTH